MSKELKRIKTKRKKVKRDYYEIEKWARSVDARNATRPKDPTELLKFNICNELNGFVRRSGMKQVDFAEFLAIPESKVSNIINLKIENFTIDRLFPYLVKASEKDELTKHYLEQIDDAFNSKSFDYSLNRLVNKIKYVEENSIFDDEFYDADEALDKIA